LLSVSLIASKENIHHNANIDLNMFVFFIVPCDYIIACNHIFLTSSNKKKVGKKEKNDLAIKQIVYDLLLIKTEIAV